MLPRPLPELVHRDDVRMGELRRRPHLALETLDAVGVPRELGRYGLQRHLPAETLVLGPVHVGHAAPAEQADNAVMTQTGSRFQCHRCSPSAGRRSPDP